ncbi:MAG: pyridoxal-phosphate-dependent aminotransferase family protein [Candidatus Heimdallarchaeaceae archaeon]
MHRRLYIPGPTEVSEDVLQAQVKPMIGHRHKDFTALYASVLTQLREYFETEQHITVFAASGTIGMDITGRNLIREGKAALSCVNGAFSKRMADTLKDCGHNVDVLEVEWGKAIKPEVIEEKLKEKEYDVVTVCQNETSTGVRSDLKAIGEVISKYPETLLVVDTVSSLGGDLILPDEMHTDFVFASTQKAFALPPGLAIMIYSEKAIKRAEEVKNRGTYTDLLKVHKYYLKKKQTPSTPAISLLYALDYQLGKMLKETAKGRYERHKAMAELTRKWALEKGFKLFAEEGYESVTVTTIENTLNKDVGALNAALAERGMELANGYGNLKDKTFRIGHMGDHTVETIQELLNNINEIWELN